ncbi:MAG: DUF4920 domain-containing protein [Polyangiaceae bacterium]|nr:DUF4920 domain-containing protein [Polyangiaceae bacterium]
MQRSRNTLNPALAAAWLTAAALSGIACERRTPPTQEALPSATSAAVATAAVAPSKAYGEKITAGVRVPLAEVLNAPQSFSGKTLIVEGDVRKACSRKGCWMEVGTSAEPSAPGCRVTFKDYAFFVPTDSAGAKARLAGHVEIENITPSFVKHLEEEGAHFPNKNADGSAQSVTFVASGVELTKS